MNAQARNALTRHPGLERALERLSDGLFRLRVEATENEVRIYRDPPEDGWVLAGRIEDALAYAEKWGFS